MSTVENPIKPCPVCGGAGYYEISNEQVYVGCDSFTCSLSVNEYAGIRLEDWNALSHAAALARAVEHEHAWLAGNSSHTLETGISDSGAIYVERMAWLPGWAPVARGEGPTLAAALIALAEQVTE